MSVLYHEETELLSVVENIKHSEILERKLDPINQKGPNLKLSHKKWRRYLKKMRRKEARQQYARRMEEAEAKEEKRNQENEYYRIQQKVEAKRREEEEARRKKDHEEWLKREKIAIEELKKQKEEKEAMEKAKEEQQRKIREEWEEKERQEKEKAQKKEELLKKEMSSLEQQNEEKPKRVSKFTDEPPPNYQNPDYRQQQWSNPNEIYGQGGEDTKNCKFYFKTGACRFGKKCSRIHLDKPDSPTILIQNFFNDARLSIPMLNERSNDSGLEYDEVDIILEYEKFYDDVIGEFREAGTVVMFKCCQNYVPHLRGNVYVQFSRHEEAMKAIHMFNGRFYAGRRLLVELSPVTNWRSSICGLFDKRLCPRGKACNFLHVFRNPGNAYSVPNRTDFDPERARRQGGFDPAFINLNHPVLAYYNQRDSYGYRSEASIRRSAAGKSSKRKWDAEKYERSRSRSRDRGDRDRNNRDRDNRDRDRDKDRDRRKRRRSSSRSRSRGRSYSRSRSKSRSRSHSRERSNRRSRRSRSKTRSRSRSKDKKRSRKHSKSSSDSHVSPKRETKNSGELSDTSTDWSDLSEE